MDLLIILLVVLAFAALIGGFAWSPWLWIVLFVVIIVFAVRR